MIFEILAVVLGLIQGTLALFNKRIHWIFYLLQLFALIIFSLNEKLYGDVFLSCIFIVFCIYGFLYWKKKEYKKISSCSLKERFVYTTLIAVGTFIGYVFLKITNDPLPFLDSFTTVISFVAIYYMVKHKIDTWILWFICDIFYAVQYAFLPNPAIYLLGLYVLWTIMALASYFYWKISQKNDENKQG